jgi:hypothetical protein
MLQTGAGNQRATDGNKNSIERDNRLALFSRTLVNDRLLCFVSGNAV